MFRGQDTIHENSFSFSVSSLICLLPMRQYLRWHLQSVQEDVVAKDHFWPNAGPCADSIQCMNFSGRTDHSGTSDQVSRYALLPSEGASLLVLSAQEPLPYCASIHFRACPGASIRSQYVKTWSEWYWPVLSISSTSKKEKYLLCRTSHSISHTYGRSWCLVLSSMLGTSRDAHSYHTSNGSNITAELSVQSIQRLSRRCKLTFETSIVSS